MCLEFKVKEGSAPPFCKVGVNHLKKTLKEFLEYLFKLVRSHSHCWRWSWGGGLFPGL